jgi:hypothetical protein
LCRDRTRRRRLRRAENVMLQMGGSLRIEIRVWRMGFTKGRRFRK